MRISELRGCVCGLEGLHKRGGGQGEEGRRGVGAPLMSEWRGVELGLGWGKVKPPQL
jgi:hypothetical protein